MRGTTFELTSNYAEIDEEIEGMFWNDAEISEEVLDFYKNPCESSFADLKSQMTEISDGVFKRVVKQPADAAKSIEIKRSRITYHRNMYLEKADQPFDSTNLNGKPGVICLALNKELHLDGFVEALESMKEGEQSIFVIDYKKMFKELGCPPRVS